jgi:hypothetical protein
LWTGVGLEEEEEEESPALCLDFDAAGIYCRQLFDLTLVSFKWMWLSFILAILGRVSLRTSSGRSKIKKWELWFKNIQV